MAVKLHQPKFVCASTSGSHASQRVIKIDYYWKKDIDLNHFLRCCGKSRQKNLRHLLVDGIERSLSWRSMELRKSPHRRMSVLPPLASADDGIQVNGTQRTTSSSDLEEMRAKLNYSLQEEDISNGLLQSLYDAARVFELAIEEQNSPSKLSWFSKAWLGVDKNAWVKTFSYQAAVYTLLQSAVEVSSLGDGRDRDINVFVQRSLLRQSAPLESLIRSELSAKQPEAYDWFWTKQHPSVVATFVNYFERDQRFIAATAVCQKGPSTVSGSPSDLSLLMLALSCIGAITKLGPAKVSCMAFFSMIPDTIGRLMDKFVDFVPMAKAYYSMKDIGLRREFLVHFGPRAAASRVKCDGGIEEISFWVDLVQRHLRRAIDREKIWSRLTTSESIEILEKDLAIFGFFVALGRSTQTFLLENGFKTMDEPIESFIRYLIGGSVLYYPQLSSISSYQLYVEVVCEELQWLPFYPENLNISKQSHESKDKLDSFPNRGAIPQVLNVCSCWMQNFIMYSKWLENPANVKAARFLSRGHEKLQICIQKVGVPRIDTGEGHQPATISQVDRELDSFDQALESVEEALKRLEELLQEVHVSSSTSGKEHLQAACSDLERIRKLKKEAEFFEASFRAKAASLQQGDDEGHSQLQRSKYKTEKRYNVTYGNNEDGSPGNRMMINSRGLWSFLGRHSVRKMETGSPTADPIEDEACEKAIYGNIDSDENEIRRFELLRNELMELEKRVQRSTNAQYEQDSLTDAEAEYGRVAQGQTSIQVQKKESIIGKSIDKLKETGTDVLQGTQLLAIDVTAAMGLLRRAFTGDELTEKEKKALRRTLTDLASVVPIGILMLLPVTAVGHAAMLAAIQRYVPALIPSAYAPERLDLLRQLEKVKEMAPGELNPEETAGPQIAKIGKGQCKFSSWDALFICCCYVSTRALFCWSKMPKLCVTQIFSLELCLRCPFIW